MFGSTNSVGPAADSYARRRRSPRETARSDSNKSRDRSRIALERVPLDVQVVGDERIGNLVRRKLTYQSDRNDRVPAYLFFPADRLAAPTDPGVSPQARLPAMLALHQTAAQGKDEAAGVSGEP